MSVRPEREEGVLRYSLAERVLHWFVALTFIYLLLSGFALGYPRKAVLGVLLSGRAARSGMDGRPSSLNVVANDPTSA